MTRTIDRLNCVLPLRLTPKLMRTCRKDLKTYCDLPDDWSMKDDISDTQIGIYLSCLYQQRPIVG